MSSSSSSSASSSPRASPEPAIEKAASKKRKAELATTEIEVDLSLPEPPSKKAKRLLKKGKPLPPKVDSDDERRAAKKRKKKKAATGGDDDDGNDDDDDDDGDGKPPAATAAAAGKKERSPHSVWIGNLRFTVTRDDLRQWLVENSGGAITDRHITRVHLPANKPHKGAVAAFENKGFAYVDFTTYDAAVAAVALSETEWHRRRLLIKDASSFEGRPEEHTTKNRKQPGAGKEAEEAAAAAPVSTSRKIFVGNMGFQTTEDDVRDLFSPCGEIEWVKVATFEDSGKCKGYGWVKFADAAAADWAVKGFVKIKEVEETEEDFVDAAEASSPDEMAEDNDTSSDESSSDSSSSSGSDSDSDSDADAASDSDASDKKPSKTKNNSTNKKTPANKKATPAPAPEKKVKMRKWWVNTLHGRRLKIEHAEDDQTRYKKRYGKDSHHQKQRNAESGRGGRGGRGGAGRGGGRGGGRHDNNRAPRGDAPQEGRGAAGEAGNFGQDISVARLTGAVVKPEGKKTTF